MFEESDRPPRFGSSPNSRARSFGAPQPRGRCTLEGEEAIWLACCMCKADASLLWVLSGSPSPMPRAPHLTAKTVRLRSRCFSALPTY